MLFCHLLMFEFGERQNVVVNKQENSKILDWSKCKWFADHTSFLSETVIFVFYPITRQQILDSSKLKKFADDNFKFDENGRKLSKRVENNVGKGEITRYEQFLLFPQCFKKACFPGRQKVSLCRNGL